MAMTEIVLTEAERALWPDNAETESRVPSSCNCAQIGIFYSLWKAGLVVAKLGRCTSLNFGSARPAASR
jgi:hypothetical protein